MQSQEQPQSCHSAGWEHHKATHTHPPQPEAKLNSQIIFSSPVLQPTLFFSISAQIIVSVLEEEPAVPSSTSVFTAFHSVCRFKHSQEGLLSF